MLPPRGLELLDELLHLEAVQSASFLGIEDLRLLYRAYLALVVERRTSSKWGSVRAFDCGNTADSNDSQPEPWQNSVTWFDDGLVLGDLHVEAGGGSRIANALSGRQRSWSDEPKLVLLPIEDHGQIALSKTTRHYAYQWYFAASYLLLGVNQHSPVELKILVDRLSTSRSLERVSSSA